LVSVGDVPGGGARNKRVNRLLRVLRKTTTAKK
jgi:hypothetical protein